VADEYVLRIFDELQHKPLDRQLLDRFAAGVRDVGPACDMGCGPGHVARYLHERGVRICGIDLSLAMIERAQHLTPGIKFRQGDMLALDTPDGTWAGIAAFYSIIHIPRGDMPQALGELHRVLRPGGLLLLAFHIGDEAIHLDEWWGHKVCIDFFFFRPEEVAERLQAAGFEVGAVSVVRAKCGVFACRFAGSRGSLLASLSIASNGDVLGEGKRRESRAPGGLRRFSPRSGH
jgi:SAM-dependent methyltransferase